MSKKYRVAKSESLLAAYALESLERRLTLSKAAGVVAEAITSAISVSGTKNVVVRANNGPDRLIVEADPKKAGFIRVRSLTQTTQSASFAVPVKGGTVSIVGADDSIEVATNLNLPGDALSLTAQQITVDAGKKIVASSVTLNATAALTLPTSPLAVAKTTAPVASVHLAGATLDVTGKVMLSASASVAGAYTQIISLGGISAVSGLASSQASVLVDGATVIRAGGDVSLSAASSVVMNGLSNATSSAVQSALDAAAATANAASRAQAGVTDSASITSGGALRIDASNKVEIDSTANGASAVAGGSVAYAKVVGATRAYIDGKAAVSASSVSVNSTADNTVKAAAVSTKGGSNATGDKALLATYGAKTSDGPVTIAGAVAITDLDSSNVATINTTGTVSATNGRVSVLATGSNTVSATSNATKTGSGGSALGVGVAVGVNQVKVSNLATIGGTKVSGKGVSVRAVTPEDHANAYEVTAHSGRGLSGNVVVAGAFALLNKTADTTAAALLTGSSVDAKKKNVTIEADQSSVATVEGSGVTSGDGGKVGVGASVALDIEPANTTDASIAERAALANAADVEIHADSVDTARTTATAGSAGGVAISPAVAMSFDTNATSATLAPGANDLTIGGDLTIKADHDGGSVVLADGTAAGEKVGIGASLAVNVPTDKASAVARRGIAAGGAVTISSTATAPGSATARAGVGGADADKVKSVTDGAGTTANDQANREILAYSPHAAADTAKAPEAKSGDGSVAVAAGLALNLAESSSSSAIADGLTVKAGGSLSVKAGNRTAATASADGSAVDGKSNVGVGVGVALNFIDASNTATIGRSDVSAIGVFVDAGLTPGGDESKGNEFGATATSGAGATTVGIAGAFALNDVSDNTTLASISGTVDARGGHVVVSATGRSTSTTEATGSQEGKATVGVGGSVAVDIEQHNDTAASIANDATLTNAGNFSLIAASDNTGKIDAASGSAGDVSVSAGVALAFVTNTTSATLGSGAAIDASGTIDVQALHSGAFDTTVDGEADAGKVGIGASVALNLTKDQTTATTQRSLLAGGDITLKATTTAANTADATASADGAKSEAGRTANDQVKSHIVALDPNGTSDNARTENKAVTGGTAGAASVGVAAALALNLTTSSAAASVPNGLKVAAEGDVAVTARNNTDAHAVADGSTVDSKVGVGVAVALNLATATNTATIGNSKVSGRGVSVSATGEPVGNSTVNEFTADATSGAGKADVGVAGALGLNIITNRSLATIAGGATVSTGDHGLSVLATSNEADTAAATSETKSKKVGVGASVALNILTTGETISTIDDGATLNADGPNSGGLSVVANSSRDVATTGSAGSTGANVNVSPAVGIAVVTNTTTARVGSGNAAAFGRGVNVNANHRGTVKTVNDGNAKKGAVNVGATVAVNVTNDTTSANVARSLSAADGAIVIRSGSRVSVTADDTGSALGFSPSGDKEKDKNSADRESQKTIDNNPNVPKQTLPAAGATKDASDKTATGKSGDTKGGDVGVAAAIGVNVVTVTNTATVSPDVTLAAGGDLQVSASSAVTGSAKSVGYSLGLKSTNVSAAVGLNVDTVTNTAEVGVRAKLSGRKVTVLALEARGEKNRFETYGLAGAGGLGPAGVAGSVGVNVLNLTTRAEIDASATVTADGGLAVQASDPVTLQNLAVAGGLGEAAGVGLAVVVNVANVNTQAVIDTAATVDARQGMNVFARQSVDAAESNPSFIPKLKGIPVATSIALAGGASLSAAGVGGSAIVDVFTLKTDARIGQRAKVNQTTKGEDDQGVSVVASDDTNLVNFAGALGASAGSAGVGIGIAVDVVSKDTRAHIDGAAAVGGGGAVTVRSTATETVTAVTGTVGAADAAGVAGSVAILDLSSPSGGGTLAYVAKDTSVTAGGAFSLTAGDTPKITMAALNAAAAGTAAVGLANTTLIKNTIVDAGVRGGATIVADSAYVGASLADTLKLTAVNGAVGGTAGVAGSAVVNVLNDRTLAHIDPGTRVETNKDLSVTASAPTKITGIAGSLAVGGTAGVGGSADVELITKMTQASVGGSADVGRNLKIIADSSETETSIAPSAAVAGTVGVALNAGVPVVNVTTKAFVAPAASLEVGGSGAIAAAEQSAIFAVAGNAGISGTAAVGAGAVVPVITKNTQSYVGEGAGVRVGGEHSITVQDGGLAEDRSKKLPTLAGGVAKTLFKNLKPVSPTTREEFRGLSVTAVNSDQVGIGGVSVGIAGTAAVNVGGAVDVSKISTSAIVRAGASVSGGESASVIVGAANDYRQTGIAGSVSGSGTAAVAPSADVRIVKLDTVAAVADGARVTAGDAVSVTANATGNYVSYAVGAAGSGEVAVDGSAGVTLLDDRTIAQIGGAAPDDLLPLLGNPTTATNADTAAQVAARNGNVLVSASDTTSVIAKAGSVGLGLGTAAVGGSVGLVKIDKTTVSQVGDFASVDAGGSIETMSVYKDQNTASGAFRTNDQSGVAVQAYSSETIDNLAASGNLGLYAGLAGGVTVELIAANTTASIGNNARVNQNTPEAGAGQSVNVAAINQTKVTSLGGGAGLGLAAIGGGVDVGQIQNNTNAFIGNHAEVSARGDIDVNALAARDVNSKAFSAAVGGVGASGSVSVWTIGTERASTYSDGTKSADALASTNANRSFTDLTAQLNGSPTKQGTKSAAGYDLILNKYRSGSSDSSKRVRRAAVSTDGMLAADNSASVVTPTADTGTNASINSNAIVASADGSVGVRAKEQIKFDGLTGQGGAGGVSIGGSVTIANIGSHTNAFIANGADVQAGPNDRNNVVVVADLGENTQGRAYAGNAGGVALGAQVVVLEDTSTQSAHVDAGSSIAQAGGAVQVYADSRRVVNANTIGGVIGGAAVGAGVTTAHVGGSSTASLSGTVGGESPVGSVAVAARPYNAANADVFAVAGGLGIAGNGAVATATVDPTITAAIAPDGSVAAAGDVDVTTNSKTRAKARARGIAAAANLAIGVSKATATIAPAIKTTIDSPVTSDYGDVRVQTFENANTADGSVFGAGATANANASGGGILSGNGAVVKAVNNATADTHISRNVTAPAGAVRVASTVNNVADSQGTGLTAGVIGVGQIFSDAVAGATDTGGTAGRVVTSVTNGKITGASLTVTTTGTNKATSQAHPQGGGLAAAVIGGNAKATASGIHRSILNPGVIVETTGKTAINTNTTRYADAYTPGNSYAGGVAVGTNKATSTVAGESGAYISNKTSAADRANPDIKAASLDVRAESADTGRATTEASAGGLINVSPSGGNRADVSITPVTYADIGRNRSVQATTGSVAVEASETPSSLAITSGSTGGVINVAGSIATINQRPTVTARVLAGASVVAKTGIDVITRADPSGVPTANSTGSAGSAIGGQSNLARISGGTDARTYVEDNAYLQAGGDVQILSRVRNAGAALATNGNDGAVSIGQAVAEVKYDSTTRVDVYNGVVIRAGGNVAIEARLHDDIGLVKAESKNRSGISLVTANSRINLEYTTAATVGANSDIAANGNVSVIAANQSRGASDTHADGVGIVGSSANANGNDADGAAIGLGRIATNTVSIGTNAKLVGNKTVYIAALTLDNQMQSYSLAEGTGGKANVTAVARLQARAGNYVDVGEGASVTGREGVALVAVFDRINTDVPRVPKAEAYFLIGAFASVSATTTNIAYLTTSVTTAAGSTIFAGPPKSGSGFPVAFGVDSRVGAVSQATDTYAEYDSIRKKSSEHRASLLVPSVTKTLSGKVVYLSAAAAKATVASPARVGTDAVLDGTPAVSARPDVVVSGARSDTLTYVDD